jgi:Uncharacterized protein, homolog of phage Mu protein gp30
MKKLRAPSKKPVVCRPLWPNAGVQAWYTKQLQMMIDISEVELRKVIRSAWQDAPLLLAQDEATGIANAAGVIFTCNDRVLLMHRTDGEGWAFPGGMVEPDETAEAGARREAFEETLHPCNGLLEFIGIQPYGRIRFATYKCEVLEEFAPAMNSEHDQYAWMKPVDAIAVIKASVGLVNAHYLHPGVRETLENYGRAVLAQDAPSSVKKLQALLAKWGQQSIKRFDLAAPKLALDFSARAGSATQTGMVAQLKESGFIVQFKPTAKSIEVYRAVAAENVGLIRSIPRKWHEQVEQKVWNAVRNGSDLSTLSLELQQLYGSTQRRAALIARDQNAKAKSVMERTRRLELGITRALWKHSHAGEKPRRLHVKWGEEGAIYEIAQGMWDADEGEYVWPGTLIYCRCSDRPVIEGAEDYADTDEPVNIELQAALRNALRYEGTARGAEMRLTLEGLRRSRVTWFGTEDIQLRRDIDQFLLKTRQ